MWELGIRPPLDMDSVVQIDCGDWFNLVGRQLEAKHGAHIGTHDIGQSWKPTRHFKMGQNWLGVWVSGVVSGCTVCDEICFHNSKQMFLFLLAEWKMNEVRGVQVPEVRKRWFVDLGTGIL